MEIEKEIKDFDTVKKEVKSSLKKETPVSEKKQTKLSYKEQRDYDTLPDEIEALEKEIDALNACLQDPKCYQEKGLTLLSDELSKLENIYEEKSNRYLEVLEIFESL